MAERSKALVLGTSLSGGVGSNPTAVIIFIYIYICEDLRVYVSLRVVVNLNVGVPIRGLFVFVVNVVLIHCPV